MSQEHGGDARHHQVTHEQCYLDHGQGPEPARQIPSNGGNGDINEMVSLIEYLMRESIFDSHYEDGVVQRDQN